MTIGEWPTDPTKLTRALRTCKRDGASYGAYRYDLTPGAFNAAPDWDATPECGRGLHVLVEIDDDWDLLDWSPDAIAQVVEIATDEVVRIGRKVKVPRLRMVKTTTLSAALCELFADGARIRELSDRIIAEAAKAGEKASGDASTLAASGDASTLAASGDASTLAASGDASKLAASGDASTLAASGDASTLAASGYASQLAASGYASQLAASGDASQLAASGYASQLAASGYRATVAAGPGGAFALAYHDGTRARFLVGYVGEDGIEPHVTYRVRVVDGRGEWERVS